MDDRLSFRLQRFGDHITYLIEEGLIKIQGRHLGGDRYELTFPLAELHPQYQTYWIRSSRKRTQITLIVIFLSLFFLFILTEQFSPGFGRRHGVWVFSTFAILILALLLSVTARRVPAAYFYNRAGTPAFTVPSWGCTQKDHREFVDRLGRLIQSASKGPSP